MYETLRVVEDARFTVISTGSVYPASGRQRCGQRDGNRFPASAPNRAERRWAKRTQGIQPVDAGKLTNTTSSTPEIRPEKIERGRQIAQSSDTELDLMLDEAMDRVLDLMNRRMKVVRWNAKKNRLFKRGIDE